MTDALREVLAPRPHYADGGAGAFNAAALTAARVRPAFFDVSCMSYRLMYAKASDYCKEAGSDDVRLAHRVASDVLCDIADACRNFACAPVLAFDSFLRKRSEIYPEYKKGPRGTQKKTAHEERVISLKGEVYKLLATVYAPTYKVQGFCVHGYESDDIIADLVLGLKQPGEDGKAAFDGPVVVVTSDGDLHQVLLDGVKLADVRTGVLCDGDAVAKHTGIRPEDVVAAKCVGGCASDNIGNVPNCGKVTVAEVLAKRSADVKMPKARAALGSEEGAAILRRNLRLIRLPYEGFVPLRLSEKVWPEPGVPDGAQALLDSNSVPRGTWPSFGDVRAPRPAGAVPFCEYKRKTT